MDTIKQSQILREIYLTKYGTLKPLKIANLRELVNIFNDIAKPKKPWTERLLFSLIKGYPGFPFTDELQRACEIYANELEGQSRFQARLHQKSFWTTNDFHPDIIIYGEELTCAIPECNIKFIKTNPAMKYCLRHRSK